MRHLWLVAILIGGVAGAQEPAKKELPSVSGLVRIKGEVPKPKKVAMNDECKRLHGEQGLRSDRIVVDGQNNLKWALVSVKAGLPEGKTYPVPKETVVLDQKGCRYEPHVFGIRVGQPLQVKNSDPLSHNVHGIPFENREFNFIQLPGKEDTIAFNKVESPIKVKCEIHSWMLVWGHAFDHPYFAVTDADGKYEIKGLPPGNYTIEAWHEACTAVSQKIIVKAGETTQANIELEERKE